MLLRCQTQNVDGTLKTLKCCWRQKMAPIDVGKADAVDREEHLTAYG